MLDDALSKQQSLATERAQGGDVNRRQRFRYDARSKLEVPDRRKVWQFDVFDSLW